MENIKISITQGKVIENVNIIKTIYLGFFLYSFVRIKVLHVFEIRY